MNVTSLRYFEAVAQEKSYSKASEKLFVTQPTLSRHVMALEQELGYRLLIRDRHTVKLTEEGRHCLQYVRAVLANVEKMKQLNVSAAASGVLHLGYVAAVESLLARELERAVRQSVPEVRIVMVPGDPETICKKFNENKLDVLFLPRPSVAALEGAESAVLVKQGLSVLLPADHPLAARKHLRLADLNGQTLLSFNPSSGKEIYEAILRLLEEKHVRLEKTVFMDSVEQIVMAVASGEGISLHASIGVLDAYELCVKRLEDCREGFDVLACWKKENTNPALWKIMSLLRSFRQMQNGSVSE